MEYLWKFHSSEASCPPPPPPPPSLALKGWTYGEKHAYGIKHLETVVILLVTPTMALSLT